MKLPVCIPQVDARSAARRDEVAAQVGQYAYTWHRPDGAATAYAYPSDERYTPKLVAHYAHAKAQLDAQNAKTGAAGRLGEAKRGWAEGGALDAAKSAGEAERSRRGTPEVCAEFFDGDRPPFVARYLDEPARRDALHAWQRVGGTNPMMSRRAAAVPGDFAVTAAHVARALGDDDSLDAARAEGRLYVADWTVLDGVVAGVRGSEQKYLYAPWALYVESRAGALAPVAIQCGPRPGAPVVTPGEGARWEAAKLVVQCADTQVQGLQLHLGRCHLLMEAFALATLRRLAEAHPVRVLLRPSFEFTLPINRSVRDELMVPGSSLDLLMAPTLARSVELVGAAVRAFDLTTALPPADIAARDMGDLRAYPWRDDGLEVWRAIRAFAGEYLALYYPGDAAVAADPELAAWAAELASPWGGRLRVPAPRDLAALGDLVAYVIFVAGPQHSVVNYGQYDMMSFAPGAPMALYGPMPAAGDDADAALARMYMPVDAARAQFGFFYEQSQLQENALGRYAPGAFLDPRVDALVDGFQRELDALETRFAERNHARLIPFPWLVPSAIRGSIHS